MGCSSLLFFQQQFWGLQKWLSTVSSQNNPSSSQLNPSSSQTNTSASQTNTSPQNNPSLPAYDMSKVRVVDNSFAVVHMGAHQFKVTAGDVIMVQKIEAEVGKDIILKKVLLVGTETLTKIGTPLLPDAKVLATVEEQTLMDKLIIYKKKRRKNYRRHKGYRHPYTRLRIKAIYFDPTSEPSATVTFLKRDPVRLSIRLSSFYVILNDLDTIFQFEPQLQGQFSPIETTLVGKSTTEKHAVTSNLGNLFRVELARRTAMLNQVRFLLGPYVLEDNFE
jgi:ribosomal protein L21